jgi:hypothetical protein
MAKGTNQEKKPNEPKGDFPEAHKEVNYIYGGLDSYESRRKQKLTVPEVMAVSLTTPEYLKWSKVPTPLIVATTRTLFQSRGGILSLSGPSSRMSGSTKSSSMEAAP